MTDFEKAMYMLSILKVDADIVPVYKGEGEIEVHIYFSGGEFCFNAKGDLLIKSMG